MATTPNDCHNPEGHYRTVELPIEPKEWGNILSAAYAKGFRLVQIFERSRANTFGGGVAIVAIVEHAQH